jgi:hypothetical protein
MKTDKNIPLKIGEALVQLGEMTQKQVEEVLDVQKKGDSRYFGEIAVDLGFIDLESIIHYLESSGKS